MAGRKYEISPEGSERIAAVDGYLGSAIRGGQPIEALIATRWLGEIVSDRAREAARAATEGSWSWSDVGDALGMSKQAAHQKLRARVHDELAKGLSRLDEAGKSGHAKIARRAQRRRERLDHVPEGSPKVESARRSIDEWERRRHEKLDRGLRRGREGIAKAEQETNEKLDGSSLERSD